MVTLIILDVARSSVVILNVAARLKGRLNYIGVIYEFLLKTLKAINHIILFSNLNQRVSWWKVEHSCVYALQRAVGNRSQNVFKKALKFWIFIHVQFLFWQEKCFSLHYPHFGWIFWHLSHLSDTYPTSNSNQISSEVDIKLELLMSFFS
jgi:hypothetical protein